MARGQRGGPRGGAEFGQLGEIAHGMFFAHPAVEKMLKAHAARNTRGIPPKIHKLSRLAELGGLELSEEGRVFLVEFQIYLLAGRYPDMPKVPLDTEIVRQDLAAAEEMIKWLKHQL